jgi:hypothetical protein
MRSRFRIESTAGDGRREKRFKSIRRLSYRIYPKIRSSTLNVTIKEIVDERIKE